MVAVGGERIEDPWQGLGVDHLGAAFGRADVHLQDRPWAKGVERPAHRAVHAHAARGAHPSVGVGGEFDVREPERSALQHALTAVLAQTGHSVQVDREAGEVQVRRLP